jgi:hypothetical protein
MSCAHSVRVLAHADPRGAKDPASTTHEIKRLHSQGFFQVSLLIASHSYAR